jgi:hypothetical protein
MNVKQIGALLLLFGSVGHLFVRIAVPVLVHAIDHCVLIAGVALLVAVPVTRSPRNCGRDGGTT